MWRLRLTSPVSPATSLIREENSLIWEEAATPAAFIDPSEGDVKE